MVDALILTHLVPAVVLLLAAIGKWRRPGGAVAPFEGLPLPGWVRSRPLTAAHPWAEAAIAVALLVLPARWNVIAAVGALGLMGIYTTLVAWALRSGRAMTCQCFGADDTTPVGRRTLARNLVLTVLTVLAVIDAATGGSVIGRVVGGGPGLLAWLAGTAVVAVVVALAVPGRTPVGPVEEPAGEEDLEDYIRAEIPDASVRTPDGRTQGLRPLAARRAQLLLFLSPGCGSCAGIAADLPRWQARDLPLDVRAVVRDNVLERPGLPVWVENAYVDVDNVWDGLRIAGTPSAVLLGTDGLLAGGPVSGQRAVRDFYVRIAQQLEDAPQAR